MLHHVEVYVSDLSASRAFWSWCLGRLGYEVTAQWDDGFTLASTESPSYLTFVQVDARFAERGYHRRAVGLNHLAFSVPDRAAVDALHQEAGQRGVALLYEDRYPFAGGADYYAVFMEDPDRIKVEFVAQGT